jgi:hypothetical protein
VISKSMAAQVCSSRTGSQGHGGDVDGQHQQDAHSCGTSQPWGEPVTVMLFQASLVLATGHLLPPPDGIAQGDVSAGSYPVAACATTRNWHRRKAPGIDSSCRISGQKDGSNDLHECPVTERPACRKKLTIILGRRCRRANSRRTRRCRSSTDPGSAFSIARLTNALHCSSGLSSGA